MVGRCPAYEAKLSTHCVYANVSKPMLNKFDLATLLELTPVTVDKRAAEALLAIRTFTEAYYAAQDIQREGEPEPVPDQLQEEINEVWKGSYLQHFHIVDMWVVFRFFENQDSPRAIRT